MERQPRPHDDIALAAVLIAVGLLVLYGSIGLPPGSFEPLGSATIPRWVAMAVIVFSLAVAAQAVAARRRASRGPAAADPAPVEPVRSRYDLAFALMVMSVLYVLVMAMDWVRFSIATLAFLIGSIGMLTAMQRRYLPVIAVLAAVLGFGLEYLFTRVFVIDLP